MPKRRVRAAVDVFERVERVARDLWWTWNAGAKRLMESLEPALFSATRNNPIATLRRLPESRRSSLARDGAFLAALARVEKEHAAYHRATTWYERAAAKRSAPLLAAYFCMEYGLHESMPLYAGGLGVLAGDHLKSASDLGVPLVAVGVLWRCGYYRQEIAPNRAGERIGVLYPEVDFDELAITDTGRRATIEIQGRAVVIRIWRAQVGRVPLFLMDTDIEANAPIDRALTRHLYAGGDPEYRIRQEMLLGIGGLAMLDALGIEPSVFHMNEGHAAFLPLERVRRLVDSGWPIDAARAYVKASSVFTTHTPVPEGNDRFPAPMLMKYFKDWPAEMGLSRREFLALGRENPGDAKEWFCMTVLALKLAERANGVSEIHAGVSRSMWQRVLESPDSEPISIGRVTNGVHHETWIADDARAFYTKHLKPKWNGAGPEHDPWARIASVPDEEFWRLRERLRARMVHGVREHLRQQIVRHSGDEEQLAALDEVFSERALTIGFARRFALYKRGTLLFHDLKRLRRIVSDAKRPVQFIFSGKAHPLDDAGHEYVREVARMTRDAGLLGRVWILEDYGLDIGRLLTAGCDVWLNNPLRPMEASGTSGMKGPLNGALNCSVLDGWWAEVCRDGKNGWAIGAETLMPAEKVVRLPRAKRDALDAESVYDTLERRIVPTFYARDSRGVPRKWVGMMKESTRTVCRQFSTHRMVEEYVRGFYWPAAESVWGGA